jgi:hypothetical protein
VAGTVTPTSASTGATSPYMRVYTLALLSTAGGAVSGNPQVLIPGRLVQVKVKPDTGGTQPTDLFDLTLLDADGVDLLGGSGANLSNAAAVILGSDPPIYVTGGTVDPVLANAGNAKGVTVTLVVQAY